MIVRSDSGSPRMRRGVAATLGSQMTAMVSSIGLLLALIRFITVEEYSRYVGVLGITSLLSAFVLSSVTGMIIEDLTRYPDRQSTTMRMAYGTLAAGWVVVVVSVMALVRLLLPGTPNSIALIIVGADLVAGTMQVIACHDQVRFSLERAAKRRTTLHLARTAGFVIVLGLTEDLLAGLIASVAAMALTFWNVPAAQWRNMVRPLLPNRSFARRGFGYLLGDTSGQLQEDFDKTIFERHHPGLLAAQYTISFRLMQAFAMPILALAGSFQSEFVNHIDDYNRFRARFRRIVLIALAYGIAGYLVLLAASFAVTWIWPYRFGADPKLLALLSLTLPIRSTVALAQNALIAAELRGVRLVSRLLSAAVAATMYVTLIPNYTWRGAVLGTLVGEITVAAITWVALARRFRVLSRSAPGTARSPVLPSLASVGEPSR
jgi:O-antigen/teichoic acid export membrane protein